MTTFLALTIWIVIGVSTGWVGEKYDGAFFKWFVFGLMLSIVGLLITTLIYYTRTKDEA